MNTAESQDTELQYLVVLSNADNWEEHYDKWKQLEVC